jgi:hypothetical protein
MTRYTTMDLFGCIKYSNGAVVAADYDGNDTPPGWSVTAGGTNASVTQAGLVTASVAGNATIQSSYSGFTPTVTVTVINTAISSLAIQAVNLGATDCDKIKTTLEGCELGGTTQQYRVIATRTNNTTQDVTGMATIGISGSTDVTESGTIPGLLTFNRNSTTANTDYEVAISASIDLTAQGCTSGCTFSTTADTDIHVLDDGAGPVNTLPSEITLAASPDATLTGSGDVAYVKATAKVPITGGNVEVDVTRDTVFEHGATGGNPSAIQLYSGNDLHNGACVSKSVSSNTTAVVDATFTDVASNDLEESITLTVQP